MVSTTVDISQGQQRSGRAINHQQGLARVYQDALAAGLGEEGARAAVAIAQTEGGMSGDVGDLSGGGSYGTFQFYRGTGGRDVGQLWNYAASQKMSVDQAARQLRANPMAGNQWALNGYLGQAIKRGLAKGMRGPALATYAQDTGQVSKSPERAGKNYQAIWSSNQPAITGGASVMTDTAASAPASASTRELEGRTKLRDKYQKDVDDAEKAIADAEKALAAAAPSDWRTREPIEKRLPGLESRARAARATLARAEDALVKAQAAADKAPKADQPPNMHFVTDPTGRVWGINPQTGEKMDIGIGSNADETMTPNQQDASARGWASLELQKQQMATDWAREQILSGTLDFNRGKEFLDRVDATAGTVNVGGKWYVGGFQPGGPAEALAKSGGYQFVPREANIVDVAAALGDPSLNRTALAGPYKEQLNQYGVKTGLEAPEKVPNIDAGAGPGADNAPYLPPRPSTAMGNLPGGGNTDVPFAGEPGGATLPEVQANEQDPRRAAAAAPVPRRDLSTMYPNGLTPQQAQESPLAADYRGDADRGRMPMPTPVPGPLETSNGAVRTFSPVGGVRMPTAADYPVAAPTPEQAALVGAAAPIGRGAAPTGGLPSFGDPRIAATVALYKSKGLSEAEAIEAAQRMLRLQGG